MDIEQLAKTVQWLDDERRKDKKDMAALQERISASVAENQAAVKKIQKLEADLAGFTAAVQRVGKIDEMLAAHRKDLARQIEEMEVRRAEAEQESDRLRKVEREGLNKSLAEVRRAQEPIGGLERDVKARKEEETRQARLVAELQQKVTDFNRYVDERLRIIAVLEEGRRQDAKRIADLQTEQSDLRRRVEEFRGKVEIVEDLARRSDARLSELQTGETERRTILAQWMDAQSIAQAERDREWHDIQARMDVTARGVDEQVHRVEQFSEANRDIKQSAESFRRLAEALDRRMTEAAEIQRLADERFRQDWAAFMADDQKRWTTHMLLRDEQWREHDRQAAKQVERTDLFDEALAELRDLLQQMQAVDTRRMEMILGFARQLANDQDQNFPAPR